MKMTVKSGDTVVVIAGKDKGKTGKVTGIMEGRVLVENVNMVSKHQKPRTQKDKGGIIRKNAPIDASNVMVICPVCGKATRVAHTEISGKKVRSCKKCGASIDKEFVKQTKKDAKKAIKAGDIKGASFKAAAKKSESENVEVKAESEKPKKTTAKVSQPKAAAKEGAEKTAAKAPAKKQSASKPVEEKEAKPATKKASTTKTAKEGAQAPKTTKKSTTAKSETK